MSELSKYVQAHELAEALNIPVTTLRSWVKKQWIPYKTCELTLRFF